MDIAKTGGYDDIVTLLTGLAFTSNNLSSERTKPRRIFFKDEDPITLENLWKLQHDGNVASRLENNHGTSGSPGLRVESVWQEKLELAKAEVIARYESRIADVELQCRKKVARIEKACGQRLQAARQLLGEFSSGELDRVPSAPSLCQRRLLSSSSSLTFYRTRSL